MADEMVTSDVTILDALRKRPSMTVAELSALMGVTATAVRQRLDRLRAQGYLDRLAVNEGRGRPAHRYSITEKGRRKTGQNFGDLAIALWQEIRGIEDPEVRRGLLRRIASRMAEMYGERIAGTSVAEKMESLVGFFAEKQVPLELDSSGELPILTAVACPYPDLAEQDRSICALERLLFSELVGKDLHLSNCRLDGTNCCTFELN